MDVEIREDLAEDEAARRWSWRRLAFWRSPVDQPGWCRPVLLAIAALAALAYGWRLGRDGLEPYYAAAVRSMSASWHDFLYGAFDPDGLVTLDKVPGAFWPQALSVRLFGVHVWAIVLPQLVEGVLAVLVLYRAVRRLAGPVAATVAAAALAVSPATVLLDRGNIADTSLVLLLVLAADAVGAAVLSGRWRWLVLAGCWVGLGFQAKMAQAWLVLPALAVPYLVAGPAPLRRRLLGLVPAAAATAVVSLSWMLVVTATPAAHRPYVDGSWHNSVFEQVFEYNGTDRFSDQNALLRVSAARDAVLPAGVVRDLGAVRPGTGWGRLLGGPYGRDGGWLLPVAVLAVAGVLVVRRRAGRQDPVRGAVLLWGIWLVTFAVVFSGARVMQPYYLAVLTPAVAALVGIGVVQAWRAGRPGVAALAGATVVTVGYQIWLCATGSGTPWWTDPVIGVAGLVAVAALVLALVTARRTVVALLSATALFTAPALAAGWAVAKLLGPFDTPYQPAYATAYTSALVVAPDRTRALIPALERTRRGAHYLVATSDSLFAANVIFVSGEEVLPIGGFTGVYPPPTLEQLRALVAAGQVHLVIALAGDSDPRITWIADHCRTVPTASRQVRDYYCLPANATSP